MMFMIGTIPVFLVNVAWFMSCSTPSWKDTCPHQKIFTCSCWAGWSFTIFSGILISFYLYRQIIKIARSFNSDWNICIRVWYHGYHGLVFLIMSDRGTQFTSWSALCSLLGVKNNTTIALHPESNSMVERFHRQLKNSLHAWLASSNWCEHLPWVLLGLSSATREDSATSTAEAVYGSDLVLPRQFALASSSLKTSGAWCLVFALFQLVTILHQLQSFLNSFQFLFPPVPWFLYRRMGMFLLWLLFTQNLPRFYLVPRFHLQVWTKVDVGFSTMS